MSSGSTSTGDPTAAAGLRPVPDPVREAADRLRRNDALGAGLSRAWRSWTGEEVPDFEASIVRVHYKPLERVRLVVRAGFDLSGQGEKPVRQYYYLQVYPDPETARARKAAVLRKPMLPCYGPSVFSEDEWNAIVYALPNGPRLRKLAAYLHPKDFRRFLRKTGLFPEKPKVKEHNLHLVRYVPRKRILLFYDPDEGAGLYLKGYNKEDHASAARNLEVLAGAGAALGFRTPALLAHHPVKRAIVMEELPGRQLTSCFGRGGDEAFRRAGTALAGLHRSRLELRVHWTLEEELERVARAAADLVLAVPDLEGALTALVRDLESAAAGLGPVRTAPIHANLFGDQVLVGEECIGMVDWDDLRLGDPAYDAGRLAAHILYCQAIGAAPGGRAEAQAAAFLDAWSVALGSAPDPARLQWHVAASVLVRSKISALRPLPEGWVEQIRRAADLSREVLAGRVGALRP